MRKKTILVFAMLGIVISQAGKTAAEGQPCRYNTDCPGVTYDPFGFPLYEFCKKEDGDCDGEGICQFRPYACILWIWPLVCGCDGRTYGGDTDGEFELGLGRCGANMAGVNIAYEGHCDECGYYLGDLDCDEDVDLNDFAIFALAWWTEPGHVRWNPDCDIGIPADDFIGMLDLAVLTENWLKDPLY